MCGCAHHHQQFAICTCNCPAHKNSLKLGGGPSYKPQTGGGMAAALLMAGLNEQANKAPLVYLTTRTGQRLGCAVYRPGMDFLVEAAGIAEQICTKDGLVLHYLTPLNALQGDTADIQITIT